jgi:hypothetical protein
MAGARAEGAEMASPEYAVGVKQQSMPEEATYAVYHTTPRD